MKNILWIICLTTLHLHGAFSQPLKNHTLTFLKGSWDYKSGHYIYYDSDNNKLKQSEVTDLQELKIEVTSAEIKIIYPDQVFYSSYTLSAEKGRKFISFDMGNGIVKYQILYLNSKFLTLKSTHNINMYIDGDPNKKAAYSVFIIYLAKSG